MATPIEWMAALCASFVTVLIAYMKLNKKIRSQLPGLPRSAEFCGFLEFIKCLACPPEKSWHKSWHFLIGLDLMLGANQLVTHPDLRGSVALSALIDNLGEQLRSYASLILDGKAGKVDAPDAAKRMIEPCHKA